MKKKQQPGRLLRLFDYNRGDRPDLAQEDTTPTLKRYFKLLGRRFWKLISLNIMMMPMIIPLMIAAYIYVGFDTTPTEQNLLFVQLYGANAIQKAVDSTFLLDLFGTQLFVPVYNSVGSYIGIGVCFTLLAVTFGWQNVGSTYVLRSMVRGEPVFLISDYFYAVKRNLKQGLVMGLIDFAAIFLLIYDILWFWGTPSTFWTDLCFFGLCAIAVLYFFMRFYIYLMLVTFDLSIRKIFKNALIFTTLGVKRNLMGALGILLLTAINVVLFITLMPLNIPIALVLPALYFLSFTAFTSAYAAYPIIDRYMIAPYRTGNDYPDKEPETSDGTVE